MPLLWKYFLEGSTNFNTAGYKVAAYTNLITWTPYASVFLLYWLSGRAPVVAAWLEGSLTFSLLGPWLLNIYAIYAIFTTGLGSFTKFLGMLVFVTWNLVQMVVQFRYVPTVF